MNTLQGNLKVYESKGARGGAFLTRIIPAGRVHETDLCDPLTETFPCAIFALGHLMSV